MSLIQASENQDKIEIDLPRLERAAEEILSALGYTDAELSIAIVDDEEMTRLNRQYRQMDSTTDVLSFPMGEGEFSNICPEMLGDVVISAPTAHLMSLHHGCTLGSVLDLLLVHGILHLLGHDHQEEEDCAAMNAKSIDLLKMLGHSETGFGWFLNPDA